MDGFTLIISTPDGNIFEGEVSRIMLRGTEGDLAILKGHVPIITAVKAGLCLLEFTDGTIKSGHSDGGILTVSSEHVTFLAGAFSWKDPQRIASTK